MLRYNKPDILQNALFHNTAASLMLTKLIFSIIFNRFDFQRSHALVLLITVAIFALVLGLGVGISYRNKKAVTTDVNYSIPSIEATTPRRVWTSIKQIPQKKHLPPSHSGTYLRAAVASDGRPCAKIGV